MTTRTVKRSLAALALAAAAACGGDKATGPKAGTLQVVLTRPNTAGPEGALLFTLSGPTAPASPVAGAGLTFWGQPFTGGNPVNVLVTGALANGQTVLTFSVDDVNKVAQYSAAITQVAADTAPYPVTNFAGGSGYLLTVKK
jgi:hypothetical protein